jgi:hypothetical protein
MIMEHEERMGSTLPTAASPSNTSLTLLLGFGAFALADSDMAETRNKKWDPSNHSQAFCKMFAFDRSAIWRSDELTD